MQHLRQALLAFLFVAGVLVWPSLHVAAHAGCVHPQPYPAHGADDGAPVSHDPAHCTICQLALTPMETAAPAPSGLVAMPAEPPTLATPAAPFHPIPHLLPFSCGPPPA